MTLVVNKIESELIEILHLEGFRFEIEKFDSGASMIDIETNNRFFCVQLTENYAGISEITEESPEFSSIPDEHFDNAKELKTRISEILNVDWK